MSKMRNVAILGRDPKIAGHIPYTLGLSLGNLEKVLSRYNMLYLKPDNASLGQGIMRVDKLSPYVYQLRSNTYGTVSKHHDARSLLHRVNQLKLYGYQYLIQQGIQSVTKLGKTLDIRVHLIRSRGNWEIAGMVGRVAPKHYLTTNAHSGGSFHYISNLFTRLLGYNQQRAIAKQAELVNLSKNIAKCMSRAVPRWTEFGLDIGVSQDGHFWLFEINFRPASIVFKHFSSSMYNRIFELRSRAS